jgi:hypothetical protein
MPTEPRKPLTKEESSWVASIMATLEQLEREAPEVMADLRARDEADAVRARERLVERMIAIEHAEPGFLARVSALAKDALPAESASLGDTVPEDRER